jgi:lipoate-protein ligase A
MNLLEITFDEPAYNVAIDEALLEEANAHPDTPETLRLWQSRTPLVVIGRGSPAEREVHLAHCQSRGIPVLRRASGGAAIVSGPGCLMYAVILSLKKRPELKSLDVAHQFVLQTMVDALRPLHSGVARQGTSDLAFTHRAAETDACFSAPDGPNRNGALQPWYKFSGNSVRVKRHSLLYHGTLLYDFPLELIGQLLNEAPRQPAYRAGRDHRSFVGNLPASFDSLRAAMIAAWQAVEPAADCPQARLEQIVADKYPTPEWTIA